MVYFLTLTNCKVFFLKAQSWKYQLHSQFNGETTIMQMGLKLVSSTTECVHKLYCWEGLRQFWGAAMKAALIPSPKWNRRKDFMIEERTCRIFYNAKNKGVCVSRFLFHKKKSLCLSKKSKLFIYKITLEKESYNLSWVGIIFVVTYNGKPQK